MLKFSSYLAEAVVNARQARAINKGRALAETILTEEARIAVLNIFFI